MLETVREYAGERLAASGEDGATRAAHASYVIGWAERLGQEPGAASWSQLERDHANVRAALEWLHAHGDAADELRLVAAMSRFWYAHSYLRKGRRGSKRCWPAWAMPSRSGEDGPFSDSASSPITSATTPRPSRSWARRSHSAASETTREQLAGHSPTWEFIAEDRGAYAEADRMYREAIPLLTETAPDLAAQTVAHLGIVATGLGDLDSAERLLHGRPGARAARQRTPLASSSPATGLPTLPVNAAIWLPVPSALRRFSSTSDWAGRMRCGTGAVPKTRHSCSPASPHCLPLPAATKTPPWCSARATPCARNWGLPSSSRNARSMNGRRRLSSPRSAQTRRRRGDWPAGRMSPAEYTAKAEMVLAAIGSHQPPAAQPPPPRRDDQTTTSLGLTKRETEVLRLLAEGLTNAQLADRLSISPSTVSSHLERIFAKLDVTTRGAAVAIAHRLGIADTDQ